MIYQKNEIDKKYVKIKDIQLDFRDNGIYLIKGGNGCGKTTLIESMIFDENESNYIFSNSEEKLSFKRNRHDLFAYVSQKITYSELRVDKYILKMNSAVKLENVYEYLQYFDLPKDILNKRFYLLSGGEQMKISIITALLKKTPYVFMDEPSNYLDNGSVDALLKVIEKEASERKFIIVTHDPRMSFTRTREFRFVNNTIQLLEGNNLHVHGEDTVNTCLIPQNGKPCSIKLFWGLNKRFSFWVTFYVMILFLVGVITYTNLVFNDSIGEEYGNYQDSILIYFVGGGHDAINETYERAENIKIDESLLDVYIDYKTIPEIASMESINAVYMLDNAYTDEVIRKLESNLDDDILVYACPNTYCYQYMDNVSGGMLLRYTEGELPKDGMSEVAISKELLISKFGYAEDCVDEAIGDIIVINEREYEIVGFSYLDIAVVSFEKENNYGYYCYDKDTYEAFCQKQIDYINEIDGVDAVLDILIELDEENEKEVLNHLMENYPSNCYLSDYYQKASYRQQKVEVFVKWLCIHILMSLMFAIIIWLIVRKATKYNMNIIWDIGNYYVNRKRIMKLYILVQCMQYLVIGLLCALVNSCISKYAYLTCWYIILDCIIMVIPIFISCKKALKEVNQ